MQRLRLIFSRSEEVKYVSHLDLMRLWQRAMRRADLPLTYSQGFSPHPRISLAAPLAIGSTSSAEIMDVFLDRRIAPRFFLKTIKDQLPRGIDLFEVAEVALGLPSLQSQVAFAEYQVALNADKEHKETEDAIRTLLALHSLPWQHLRDDEVRKYDLRALIDNVWLIKWAPRSLIIGMRLSCDSTVGTGRPEQVTLALGFPQHPLSIHRTRLILAQ